MGTIGIQIYRPVKQNNKLKKCWKLPIEFGVEIIAPV